MANETSPPLVREAISGRSPFSSPPELGLPTRPWFIGQASPSAFADFRPNSSLCQRSFDRYHCGFPTVMSPSPPYVGRCNPFPINAVALLFPPSVREPRRRCFLACNHDALFFFLHSYFRILPASLAKYFACPRPFLLCLRDFYPTQRP